MQSELQNVTQGGGFGTMAVIVRFLEQRDSNTLDRLLRINEEEGIFEFGWTHDGIRQTATEPNQTYWIGAFDNDELIGICSVGGDELSINSKGNVTAMILSDVYIIPDRRHTRVGTILIWETIRLTKEKYTDCSVHIGVLDEQLIPFCKRFGFEFDKAKMTGTLRISDLRRK